MFSTGPIGVIAQNNMLIREATLAQFMGQKM